MQLNASASIVLTAALVTETNLSEIRCSFNYKLRPEPNVFATNSTTYWSVNSVPQVMNSPEIVQKEFLCWKLPAAE